MLTVSVKNFFVKKGKGKGGKNEKKWKKNEKEKKKRKEEEKEKEESAYHILQLQFFLLFPFKLNRRKKLRYLKIKYYNWLPIMLITQPNKVRCQVENQDTRQVPSKLPTHFL